MTKKDFEAIAAALNGTLRTIRDDESNGLGSNIEPDAVLMDATYNIARVLAADNPRFDRDHFIEAALRSG